MKTDRTPHHERVGEPSLRRLSSRTVRSLTLEDPTLLRATPVARVLQRCGRLLAKSDGDAETFKLSSQVQVIDAFISHNWSTPRFQKWMVLAIYFNLSIACSTALLAMTVLAILTYMRVLPCIHFDKSGMIMSNTGVFCMFTGSAVFSVMLFFGREVLLRLGLSRGSLVFLDKTCIHQTDLTLKEKGIRSLAAQMNHSRAVVVVYAETYLRKVWTVYELASALILWPEVRLVVMPLFVPKLVIAGIVLGPARFGTLLLVKTNFLGDWGDLLSKWGFEFVLLPFYVAAALILRAWGKERGEIRAAVKSFDVRTAACFVETDRQLVQGNIITFMRDFGLVKQEASDIGVLEAFNDLVHKKIPGALVANLGHTGVPCIFLWAVLVSGIGRFLDSVTPLLISHAPMCTVICKSCTVLTLYASIIPNAIAMMSWLLGKQRHLRGCAEKVLVAASIVLAIALTLGPKVLLKELMHHAINSTGQGVASTGHAIALASGIASSFAVTYLLFRPSDRYFSHGCCELRRANALSTTEMVGDSESISDDSDRGMNDDTSPGESTNTDEDLEDVQDLEDAEVYAR